GSVDNCHSPSREKTEVRANFPVAKLTGPFWFPATAPDWLAWPAPALEVAFSGLHSGSITPKLAPIFAVSLRNFLRFIYVLLKFPRDCPTAGKVMLPKGNCVKRVHYIERRGIIRLRLTVEPRMASGGSANPEHAPYRFSKIKKNRRRGQQVWDRL